MTERNTDTDGLEAAYRLGCALSELAESYRTYHVRDMSDTAHTDRRIGALVNYKPVRAKTLCGGEVTGRDWTPSSARALLRDGQPVATQMCRACLAALGANGESPRSLANVTDRSGTISPKQVSFLRALLREAFAAHYATRCNLDPARLETVSRRTASAAIDELVAAKRRGWK